MGRKPCCSKNAVKKGAWTASEDKILTEYITAHGEGKWRDIPRLSGLQRCGKSCRLRWLNYLRPDIKRGNISADEEDLIIRLHRLLGNRWSLIAGRLPGRTDNEIKNYWNTHLGKKPPPNRNKPFPPSVSHCGDSTLLKPATETAILSRPIAVPSSELRLYGDMNVAKTHLVESCSVPAMHWSNGIECDPEDFADLCLDFEMGDVTLCGEDFDWLFSESGEVYDFHGTETSIRSHSTENLADTLEKWSAGQQNDNDGGKSSSSAAGEAEGARAEDWVGYSLLTRSS